jgi:uncharacterized protein (DUF302 family)
MRDGVKIERRSNMSYYFSKVISQGSFENALSKVRDALKEEGFGVLTEIDVKSTLKKKLDVEFRNYRILGACNPQFAYKALQADDKIGTMLPCSVIVQETADGHFEVAAIDPAASMKAIENHDLEKIADMVRVKLKSVIDSL